MMSTSRCTSSVDLNHPAETRQLKKAANFSRENSPQDELAPKEKVTVVRMSQANEKSSLANSISIHMPLDLPLPSLGIPSETSRLLRAGAFVPPERENVAPSMDHETRPFNFGTVIPGVYRSSYPQEHDYRFIKSLGLRSIVTLVHKEMPPTFKPFLDSEGIMHHVFNMKGTKKESIPLDVMRGILSVVLDSRHHPLLIHCNHGKHRTGCVVGIVRKLSGWHLNSIHNEYKTYAEPKARETDLDYIANFNIDRLANIFPRPSMMSTPITLRSRPRYRFIILALVIAALIFHFFRTRNLSTDGFHPRVE
ncbi:hypothetical protein MKZ38_009835 [Zalerion maritima]|uniref:diphosphoinositol-polyphosphate diphosphatase n=1 Tax=Zalerion maritima TaxID=339359 RepID=A0AAD5RYA9_9PEZI|nr:hypothetical protein MKZ38_009835 [Zalerion maritima]